MRTFQTHFKFFLSAFFFAAPAIGQSFILDQNDFKEIKNVSEKTIQKFQGQRPVYLGIGRSPTPIIAYLQLKGHPAINLPMGGLNAPQFSTTQELNNLYLKLRPDIEKALLPYKGTQTQFVVMDYVSGGRSHAVAMRMIEMYAAESCPGCKVDGLIYSKKPQLEARIQNLSRLPDLASKRGGTIKSIVLDEHSRLADIFKGEKLDHLSEYDSFDVRKDTKIMKNPTNGFAQLKSWLYKMMTNTPGNQGIIPPTSIKPEESITAKDARKGGGLPRGIFGVFSFAFNFLSFIPQNNPFATVIGVNCKDAENLNEKVLCTKDSTINYWTDQFVCTRSERYAVINKEKNVCSVEYEIFRFSIKDTNAKQRFLNSPYFNKKGYSIRSNDFEMHVIKFYKSLEFQKESGSVPESKNNHQLYSFQYSNP